MILAAKAMEPDGPVAISDLYYRRNLWLLAFGLFDVFFLLWPGDILHIYALAALFLFPFRRLAPRRLLMLGLGWAVISSAGIPAYGAREYVARTELINRVEAAQTRRQAGAALTERDREAVGEWEKLLRRAPNAELRDRIERERQAHAGRYVPYVREAWSYWSFLVQGWLIWDVIEAFCTMLIGVALWKWGVIQGQRSTRFYVAMLVAAYGFGVTVRFIGIQQTFSFVPGPRILWVFGEYARLAVGLGHLAAVNLAVRTRIGSAILAPFRAAGRMAFSLYFLQQFVGMYILFAPFGLNLWGRFGWAQMAAIATVGIALQLVLANLWFRGFVSGPLEWLWRSLAYVKRQPLLRVSAPRLPDPASRPAPSAA
jgi:uncharacterized protein